MPCFGIADGHGHAANWLFIRMFRCTAFDRKRAKTAAAAQCATPGGETALVGPSAVRCTTNAPRDGGPGSDKGPPSPAIPTACRQAGL